MTIEPSRPGARSAAAVFVLTAALGFGGLRHAASPAAAAPAATSKKPPAAQAAGEATDAAKQDFMKVVGAIKQKIATAPDKMKAAREAVTTLQKYAADHSREPISDSARLTAAQLQLQLGDTDEGLAGLRQIAARPIDRQAGRAAQFFLAQTLAENGKQAEAEKLLSDIIARNDDPKSTPVAKMYLAQVLTQQGKSDQAEKVLKEIIAANPEPGLAAAAKNSLTALGIRPGQKLPAFTVKDIAGKSHSPGDYAGQVLLVDFWATWCGPCRQEMPNVKKLFTTYKDRGFAILGISLDRKQADLDAYLKEQTIEWPQVFEGAQKVAEQYVVESIPHTLLVDRQGVIRYVDARGSALEKAVEELVGAEKKTEPAPAKP